MASLMAFFLYVEIAKKRKNQNLQQNRFFASPILNNFKRLKVDSHLDAAIQCIFGLS